MWRTREGCLSQQAQISFLLFPTGGNTAALGTVSWGLSNPSREDGCVLFMAYADKGGTPWARMCWPATKCNKSTTSYATKWSSKPLRRQAIAARRADDIISNHLRWACWFRVLLQFPIGYSLWNTIANGTLSKEIEESRFDFGCCVDTNSQAEAMWQSGTMGEEQYS